MRAIARWTKEQQYIGESDSGHSVGMDAGAAHLGGPSPMEMVLMALCGCTSVDVVSILSKKREPFTSLTVTAEAERAEEPPRMFTHIHLRFHVGGSVSAKAMQDAVALSKNKYCSVSKMLEKSVSIDFEITYDQGQPSA